MSYPVADAVVICHDINFRIRSVGVCEIQNVSNLWQIAIHYTKHLFIQTKMTMRI